MGRDGLYLVENVRVIISGNIVMKRKFKLFMKGYEVDELQEQIADEYKTHLANVAFSIITRFR